MTTLKVTIIDEDKQTTHYAQSIVTLNDLEIHLLGRLGNAAKDATLEKYYIDEDGDNISVLTENDFKFMVNESKKIPKIYIKVIPNITSNNNKKTRPETLFDENSLSIHPTVECDVCLTAPIRGFRYKCLQCYNFDLCMKCEAEMKHPDHLMLRIPNTNSPSLEKVCPVSVHYSKSIKRQQRQAARAAAAANAAAEQATAAGSGEGKSRHHRHHRKQCSVGAGLLSNFYDMMQDLAEGGVAVNTGHENQSQSREATPPNSQTSTSSEQATAPPQQPESPIEQVLKSVKVVAENAAKEAATAAAVAANAATAAAAANSISKETNTSPNATATSSSTFTEAQTSTPTTTPTGVPITPILEQLIDPTLMKAGIQILSNFSEMFGKILDPVVTEGTTRNSSFSASGSVNNVDLTGEDGNGATATPPPTAADNSRQSSNSPSGLVTPMETEQSANNEAQNRSRNSQSEENDWTMIDDNIAADAKSAASNGTASAASSIDFIKLSQQLQSHIQSEMESNKFEMTSPDASVSTPQVSAPTPAPVAIPAPAPAVAVAAPAAVPAPETVPTPPPASTTERRAIAVFHSDPRINSAVHGMMAMGFSNEGAVLTQLLESVDGSIPRALDLMTDAQRY